SEEGRLYRMYSDSFSYVYPYENLKKLYAKTSVSELKHAAMEEAGVKTEFETDNKKDAYVPLFARERQAGGTERGSAYHRIMELLELTAFKDIRDDEKIRELIRTDIDGMIHTERLTVEQAKLVSINDIAGFLKKRTAERMERAAEKGKLFREQPFVISIEASRLDKDIPKGETIMIQGVIDVFWEEDGKMILLDYKTDRVSGPDELIARYKTQMDHYAEAITRIMGKEVSERIIYSFSLGEEILC
ncbi:MAG: PD-(D/E)XK nuclease family protein, partial [Lachnospiraceae bacterium]|nr:PD-(D/E)XK nuclease family protein [Lachnospiraceae bacterium]